MSDYELLRFTLPVDLEERFVAELWSLGALGFETSDVESGRLRLDAWFSGPISIEPDPLTEWSRHGVELIATTQLEDRDWLSPYRAAAEPFDVGCRFRIDPGEASSANAAPEDSRFVLKVPAQTAFGTGSHESTRLVLEWLEDLHLNGLAVLDVGAGSGILSFATELLGASRTVAFDIDAPSICIARSNAGLNRVMPQLFAGGIAALRPERRFDLALVNILPENFRDIPHLAGLLKPGGRVISSGNLSERRDELLGRWQERGFTLEDERHQAEWTAFLLRATA